MLASSQILVGRNQWGTNIWSHQRISDVKKIVLNVEPFVQN
jgi:hypothetical protein